MTRSHAASSDPPGAGSGPSCQSSGRAEMADDAPPLLPQEGAPAGTVSAASSPRESQVEERTEPSPRSSLTGEPTGPPKKGKSKLASLSNKVLMTVSVHVLHPDGL